MRYAVFGIGGFGREVAPLIADRWMESDPSVTKASSPDIVFVDDDPERPRECNELPVIGFDDLVSDEHRDRKIVVAIGDGRTREKIENRCRDAGLLIGSVMARTARSLQSNEIGSGAVLCDHVLITANAKIGRSFQANIYSYVAHDCVVGDYVTFAPRVSCNGNVKIENYAYIGTGATIIQGRDERPLLIGEGAVIGMGAVVTKPVEAYTIVTGNPARLLRKITRPD